MRCFITFWVVFTVSCSASNDELNNDLMALSSGFANEIDSHIIERAVKGIAYFKPRKSNVLILIDMDKPSSEKRFYVVDLKQHKILYKTYVAHGVGSGNLYAKRFSNVEGSKQTSLGFYKTAETYRGKHGYSLRLDGLEKNLNDKARKRAIVIHGADYVSEDFVRQHGRLGRSWGCPALPRALTKEIIDFIKKGSLVYIHSGQKSYLAQSKIK